MATLDRDILKLQPEWLDPQRPRLGRYVLGPLLGQGGMGEVVEAWDVVLCRTVALKVLRNVEPTAVIRFMHEAQIQARIVHPNICRIYDVDATEGTVKIAMQLVRGPNLEQAARDLSITEAVTLMAQVSEAVHAAHRLKLIHRDLKPSNILLERGEDGRWFPFICDFGLAMAMDEPSLTYSNSVIGTPAYMAPEQFRGLRDLVGPATDVYGLGGTLHFVLMGRAPDGPTPRPGTSLPAGQAMARPITQELPRDLKTILRKCLEADPELRYPTASALADDLWCLLNGQPIHGTVAGPVGRLWRKRKPLLKTSLFATLGVAVLAGAWFLERTRAARLEQARRSVEWYFATEAGDLVEDLRLERMLPVHDLRPAYSRIQARMDRLRARLAQAGPAAAGPGHLALASVQALLGNPATALAELEQARAGGLGPAEAAEALGYALAAHSLAVPGWPPAETLRLFEGEAQENPTTESGSDRFNDALLAFLRKDYARAAAEAFVTLQSHPWSGEAKALEGLSLAAQARKMFDDGDLAGAEGRYREAMAGAEDFLARVPGDERVRHVYLLAARGLCLAELDRGGLDPVGLGRILERCELALRLNPGDSDLQGDWLELQILKAQQLEYAGKDPGALLEQARVFADTRLKPPIGGALRNLQVGLLLHSAMLAVSQGRDPGLALGQAVREPLATPPLEQDHFAQALAFLARLELVRGGDPRPAVAAVQAHLPARVEEQGGWSSCETAGEAWLIQAQWEAGHGQDPGASLGRARALALAGLRKNPRSGSGLALEGLICAQEARGPAGAVPGLVLQAQDRLRQSRALGTGGRLQAQLAGILAKSAAKAS